MRYNFKRGIFCSSTYQVMMPFSRPAGPICALAQPLPGICIATLVRRGTEANGNPGYEKDEWLISRDVHVAEWDALLQLSGGDGRRLLNLLGLVVSSMRKNSMK